MTDAFFPSHLQSSSFAMERMQKSSRGARGDEDDLLLGLRGYEAWFFEEKGEKQQGII